MLCPKCGQELTEQERLCPHCGEAINQPEMEAPEEIAAAAEETAAQTEETTEASPEESCEESSEETADAEEAAEAEAEQDSGETEEAAEEPPKKKKSGLAILSGVIIALLLVIVVGLGFALKYVSDGNSLPSVSDLVDRIKDWNDERNYDPEALAVTVTDADGQTVTEMNNRLFGFYYWGEYYYFVNYYGYEFDSSLPLDEQVFEEVTDSETGETTVTTWHDYFMDCARYSIAQVEAMKAEGKAAGFEMPEDYQAEYDNVVATMATNATSAGFTDDGGNGDVLAYIRDSYGEDVTVEDFEQYLYDSYYASAYSDEIYYSLTYDDSELEAYFDENADYFASYGIEKLDIPNVNVRHILVEPEYSEDGTISDEAWEAAEAEAERIYEEWQSGDATEDSFGELANTYSADPGSNTNGGLYDNVYPGKMVDSFNAWCFDENRQIGDTDIVKTDYGYHIMYFVGYTDEYYWRTVAESDARYYDGNALLEEMAGRYTATVSEQADIRYPAAVKTIMGETAA